MKCLACGSTNLVKGRLQAEDGAVPGFQFNNARWLKRVLSLDKRGIRAYGCMRCGHLQLAVDFSDQDREQYQQFEGEQPDLLDRINQDS